MNAFFEHNKKYIIIFNNYIIYETGKKKSFIGEKIEFSADKKYFYFVDPCSGKKWPKNHVRGRPNRALNISNLKKEFVDGFKDSSPQATPKSGEVLYLLGFILGKAHDEAFSKGIFFLISEKFLIKYFLNDFASNNQTRAIKGGCPL